MTPNEALKNYFGHDTYRPGQEKIVHTLLSGKDALCVMPTGGGKSVCYQIPAVLFSGITLVISPLISLMRDQVRALKEAGIPAAYLNSSLTPAQMHEALRRAALGWYKIIYVAPERLPTDSFLHFAKQADISLLAVDEAHCISQWGQDFRPSYLKIAEFVEQLPKRPVIGAFTATATAVIRDDIERLLCLQQPFRITTGFDRENLYFEVQRPKSKNLALLDLLRKTVSGSGIIYCATRKNVEQVCDMLKRNGYNATRYHAGLDAEERRINQEDFAYDRAQIMVATNAFGMGIDKSDVSFVIHYNMPKNIEAYYQEAGRAGRDGSPARCILLYSGSDVRTNQFLIDNAEPNPDLDSETQAAVREREREKLKQMTIYCTTSGCLRAYLLQYFGEDTRPQCGNCGSCCTDTAETDCTAEAKEILQCIDELPFDIGKNLLCDVLRGSRSARIQKLHLHTKPSFGALFDRTQAFVRNLIEQLIADGYIGISDGEYPTLYTTADARDILQNDVHVTMLIPLEKESRNEVHEQPFDPELLRLLKLLRGKIASLRSVPAYVIFTDATLRELASVQPQNDVQLLQVSGIGLQKSKQYGKAFLHLIRIYSDGTQNDAEAVQRAFQIYLSSK